MQQNQQQRRTYRANPPNKTQLRLIARRATMPLNERNAALAEKISQMRLTIAPIVHVQTGNPPPQFPSSMLQLFLLTEDQLDAMARYYSQVSPSVNTYSYPQTMDWAKPFLSKDPLLPKDCKLDDVERLKVKMRMFARFIGMRGAETPRWEYERQIEILRNKIAKAVEEEERDSNARRKVYWGPSTHP